MDAVRAQFKRSGNVKVVVTCATAGRPVIAGAAVRGPAPNAADRTTRLVACLPILGCPAAPVLTWRHAPEAGR